MKPEHEKALSYMLGQPNPSDVIMNECDEIQDVIVRNGWPENRMIHGILFKSMLSVYKAGERRGVARETSQLSGLFPLD